MVTPALLLAASLEHAFVLEGLEPAVRCSIGGVLFECLCCAYGLLQAGDRPRLGAASRCAGLFVNLGWASGQPARLHSRVFVYMKIC